MLHYFLHLGVCRSIKCYLTFWYCILFDLASALAALLTHLVTMGLSGASQSSISISSYPPKRISVSYREISDMYEGYNLLTIAITFRC
jgi:hypothetical protein